MSIEQNLENILVARYGEDVRQAIHDAIELGYNIASSAMETAETAQNSASASATAAANSATAAQTAANNAYISAGLAEQYKEDAFHTTPVGYEDFVSETNSSLNDLYNNGVKNLIPNLGSNRYENNGLIFVKNSDGTVTVTGTASEETYYSVIVRGTDDFKLAKGFYKLAGCPSGGGGQRYSIIINCATANGSITLDTDNGNGGSGFEITDTIASYSSYSIGVTIIIRNGQAIPSDSPLIFKPMVTLATTPNSDYAHYVPYAHSNAALTATTILKSIRIYGDGSKTQATLLNELFTALNGLGKNVLVSKVVFRTSDGPSNIQMGSVYDHNLSYFNVFNVTVGANDIVHSNVYLNSSSSRAIQNTNGTSVNYSSQVLTSSQYVELDYYEM